MKERQHIDRFAMCAIEPPNDHQQRAKQAPLEAFENSVDTCCHDNKSAAAAASQNKQLLLSASEQRITACRVRLRSAAGWVHWRVTAGVGAAGAAVGQTVQSSAQDHRRRAATRPLSADYTQVRPWRPLHGVGSPETGQLDSSCETGTSENSVRRQNTN